MDFISLFGGVFEQIMTKITDVFASLCEGGLAELFNGFLG
jgi:hypothetical protein